MFKKLVIALILILLIVGGLAYYRYPGMASLAATWLQASASSIIAAVSATGTLPAPDAVVTATSTPTREKHTPTATRVTASPPTATATNTATPTLQIEATPSAPPLRSTPPDQATADYLDALATADAFIKGMATPTPPPARTVTPNIPAAASTLTPTPPSMMLVIVTQTPTPKNAITAAAHAATATAVATAIGTYTPVPWNWVAPIVIIPEPPIPLPANAATAAFQVAEATALAFVNGTPTPWPFNVWTATPTPFMRPVVGEVATPWLPPPPTPTPLPIPRQLVGKIVFLSNRSGGPQPLAEPLAYVIDPDGGNLAVLTDYTFYNTALVRDTYSADQQYRAFAKESSAVPAIFYFDYHDNLVRPITFFGFDTGGAWEPAWSPMQEQIAFVSDVTQHEEIWVANRDGSGTRQVTQVDEAENARESGKDGFVPEANGHPSWSPDGSQIVFWSTRTGRQQIWVMNADGSNAHLLSPSQFDDWDPIWVKYTDPAREAVLSPGELLPNVVN